VSRRPAPKPRAARRPWRQIVGSVLDPFGYRFYDLRPKKYPDGTWNILVDFLFQRHTDGVDLAAVDAAGGVERILTDAFTRHGYHVVDAAPRDHRFSPSRGPAVLVRLREPAG
jgi:hypothetical protein